jgi:ATP-dependent RNA helicase DDX3X
LCVVHAFTHTFSLTQQPQHQKQSHQDTRQQQYRQESRQQQQQQQQQQQRSNMNRNEYPSLGGEAPKSNGIWDSKKQANQQQQRQQRDDMPTDFRRQDQQNGSDWRDNPNGGQRQNNNPNNRDGGQSQSQGQGGGMKRDFRTGGRNNHGNAKRGGRGRLVEHVYEATGERFMAAPRDLDAEERMFGQEKTGINFAQYNKIDVEVSGNNPPQPIESFEESKMHPLILSNIFLAHFKSPTPIQVNSLPILVAGRDLMACAQTGSGKTGAFLFPLIDKLLRNKPSGKEGRRALPTGLIIAPTRELAVQINMEAEKFVYRSTIRNVVVYGGGQNQHEQRSALSQGCDILVGTPGRLIDFVDRRYISLDRVSYFVLDEADRMLDMGFEIQIREIVDRMPNRGQRQTLMFSATFPTTIQRLASDFLNDYMFIAVGRVGSSSSLITQKLLYVDERQKEERLLRQLAECEGLTLVFVETKRAADALEGFLYRNDIDATSIHGDREQDEREEALAMFRCGRCPVLVATDVAARGLDIPNVSDVFNYDMPNTIDDYVHRIGRTGRAGHKGTSCTFVNERNRGIFPDLHKVLLESDQEIPSWFSEMLTHSSGGGGGGGRGNKRGDRSHRAQTDFRRGEGGGERGGGRDNNRSNGGRDNNKSNGGGSRNKKKGKGGGGGFSMFGGAMSKGGSYGGANDAW